MDSKHSRFSPKSIFWAVASIVLLLVVSYAIMSGAPIKNLSVPGVMDVEFDTGRTPVPAAAQSQPTSFSSQSTSELERKIAELEKRDLDQREAALQQRLKELEQKMAQREQQVTQSPAPAALPQFNLNGTWRNNEGLSYIFQQMGNRVTIQEINPLLGIVQAVGEGTIIGDRIELNIQTVLGVGGSATLRISSDGNQMSGTVTDQLTNMPQPITIYR